MAEPRDDEPGAPRARYIPAVTDAPVIDAWSFPRGFDVASVALVARDGRTPPDVRGRVVSERGDVITLQVVSGKVPTPAEFLLYLAGRGAQEILRREEWPGGRVLLTLRSWKGG